MGIARISLLAGLASLAAAASAFSASPERGAQGAFAARIGAGPVSVSCDGSGPSAGRVRVAAQVAYSDLAGPREPLRGYRHRGSVELVLSTGRGRTLARKDETRTLGRGFAREHVHHTHVFVLGRPAGRRVLRYAHGSGRCGADLERDRVVEVAIGARQRLKPGASGGRGYSNGASLAAQAPVIPQPVDPATTCPPYSCYSTAEDALAWRPSFVRPFDVASVPLAARVASPAPGMLVGLDDGPWAYWWGSDLNAQGARNGNVYNFTHWQYVDTLYYYVHQVVSVPPTVWVNAAHRNGVPVLGAVTGDCDGCGDEMNELFERGPARAANLLYGLAATYGFDGWVIDVEAGAERSDELLAAMRDLSARTLPNGRRVEVAYYEAGKYVLDEGQYKALLAAGSWQADYDPYLSSAGPQGTYDFLQAQSPPATDRRFETYWASYVYSPRYEQAPPGDCETKSSERYLWNGTRCNDIGALFDDQRRALGGPDPPGFLQSLSLFAPAWTMFGGLKDTTDPLPTRDAFQELEERLWTGVGGYRETAGQCSLAQPSQNSVSSLVAPRSVLSEVPFVSRFNSGEGSRFYVEGADTGAGRWNLLSAQDPLPTGICGEGETLAARIDYGDAYDGGSSLRVTGTAAPGSRRLYLYEADAPLSSSSAFVLRHSTAAGPAPHVVVWIDGQGPIDLAPAESNSAGGWAFTLSRLPESVSSGRLTRIGVGFDVGEPQVVITWIGELGVVDMPSYRPPARLEATISGDALSWTDPAGAPPTRHYNVWAVNPDRGCVNFTGRSFMPSYDLVHPLFGPPSDAQRFVIQPVTTSGLAAEVPLPPC